MLKQKFRNSFRKIVLLLLVLIFTCSFFINTASAVTYNHYTYGYHYSTVDVDNYTYLWSPYFTLSAQAVNSWNTCGLAARNISPNTSSINKVYAENRADWWDGCYESLVYDTTYAQTKTYFTTKFKIILNTTKLSTYLNTPQRIQGVICHEFGHALGLDHNDNTSDPMYTLMRTSTTQCINIYVPKPYDITAVNVGWPNWVSTNNTTTTYTIT